MSQQQDNQTVKHGIAIGVVMTLILYLLLYILLPHYHHELQQWNRIQLAAKCLVIPGLFLLLLILRIGSMRFGNAAQDPTTTLASSKAMEINLRVLSNTHEQMTLFIINTLGLAVFLPFAYLSLLPIYSGLFVVGRLLFWAGYRHNILWRAPGFAIDILPAVFGLLFGTVIIIIHIVATLM